ncbi:MAG: CDP-alcohol phosphatidyltransferase family protein, partial [Acutalibacteraceae bacterium]
MKDNDIKSVIKKNLTVPNLLSFIRILVIPPLIIFLLDQNFIMAGVMLIISGVSDMFDGMIARKFNQVTQLGKMLDPIADKLT